MVLLTSHKPTLASRPHVPTIGGGQCRPDTIASDLVETLIEDQEGQLRRKQEADLAWKHYQNTGLHIDGQEAIAWLRSLATAHPIPKPQVKHHPPLAALRT
jgi:hypothetical protein